MQYPWCEGCASQLAHRAIVRKGAAAVQIQLKCAQRHVYLPLSRPTEFTRLILFNSTAIATSYGAGLEHDTREIISARMAGLPSGMRGEQPVRKQPQQLTRKRKDGMANTDGDAGEGTPKTITLKSSQKMLDLEDQAVIGLTSAYEDALDNTCTEANKMCTTNTSTEVEEGMGQGNTSSSGFDAVGEGHATNSEKGKGRASPMQSQHGSSSTVRSACWKSVDKDSDDDDISMGNQLGDFKLLDEYGYYYCHEVKAKELRRYWQVLIYYKADVTISQQLARTSAVIRRGVGVDCDNYGVDDEEAGDSGGDSSSEDDSAPGYENADPLKPAAETSVEPIANQELEVNRGGNRSDSGDECNEGGAKPEPPRRCHQDPPHTRSTVGLLYPPSSPSQCHPYAVMRSLLRFFALASMLIASTIASVDWGKGGPCQLWDWESGGGLRGSQHVVAGRCWVLGDLTAGGPSVQPMPLMPVPLISAVLRWTLNFAGMLGRRADDSRHCVHLNDFSMPENRDLLVMTPSDVITYSTHTDLSPNLAVHMRLMIVLGEGSSELYASIALTPIARLLRWLEAFQGVKFNMLPTLLAIIAGLLAANPTSPSQLFGGAVQAVWEGITDNEVAMHTSRMGDRVWAVRKAKGWHTIF
ncbi:hypothetical protein BC834DRAFT_847350 [Gloeopeniophorella convolvens]|nr:hypothetical protein BC834DRAFT_847350 [Gloeopeniophorella convolvens]